MTALRRSVLDQLKLAGVTRRAYVDHFFGAGNQWGGDRCGCVDDRCIGFHHDETQACHCFPVWLDELLNDRCECGLPKHEERG